MDSGKLDILESLGKQTDSPKALLARLRELQGIVAQGSSDPESPFLISTIHSSKGLEYQRVILMDVADGILPSIDPPRGSHPDPEEVELYEEERRLFYVGMTRAKEELAIFRFRPGGFGEYLCQHPLSLRSKSGPPSRTGERAKRTSIAGGPGGPQDLRPRPHRQPPGGHRQHPL